MKTLKKTILIVLMCVAFVATAQAARRSATVVRRASSAATRQSIRQMPILARPNRVGHFYGNTVRRRYYQRGIVPRTR